MYSYLKNCPWIPRLGSAAGLVIAFTCAAEFNESLHAHEVLNPHSDRRERNEHELRAETRVRIRQQCRVNGDRHYELAYVSTDHPTMTKFSFELI